MQLYGIDAVVGLFSIGWCLYVCTFAFNKRSGLSNTSSFLVVE